MRAAPGFLMNVPILKKGVRGIWKRLHWALHGRYFVERRLGLDLLFDMHNSMDKYLVAFGRHEDAQIDYLFSTAKTFIGQTEKATFLDVGAHWGLYALLAWRSGQFEEIVAVEADVRNARQLEANLFLNACGDDVRVLKGAASDTAGELSFMDTGSKDRTTMRVLDREGDEVYAPKARNVQAFRLDDEVSLRGGVLVIKIDVEGHEQSVIAGMSALLRENRCLLQVEVFDQGLAAFVETMDALGYRLVGEIAHDRYFQND